MATNNKYDRQLRLWGAQGQKALGETHVVLVGASAVGTETLKNLVLPGIGSFSVLDDCMVSKQDVASNFFVTTVGESRAQAACTLLKELNPDVQGSFQSLSKLSAIGGPAEWEPILRKDATPTTTKANNSNMLVLASDLEPNVVLTLSETCDAMQIPFVVVRSYGLMGLVRVQLSGQVPLLNPKPTTAHPDLRIVQSFPGLDAMASSIDLDSLESHEHGHVPYPIVLYHCLKEWRESHDHTIPKTYGEKQAFQQLVRSKRRNENEVNFDEAIQNAYLAYTEQSVEIPDHLADPSSSSSSTSSSSSSIMGQLYAGLQTFMDRHNRAPLNGAIPDMTASTESYVKLQQVYKDQAAQDLEEMKTLCKGVLEQNPEDGTHLVESFCANVFLVQHFSTRSVLQEFKESPNEELAEDLQMMLMDPYEVPHHTPLLWFLGLRACMKFQQSHGRYPGTKTSDWEDKDVASLEACYKQVAEAYKLADQELVQKHAEDICHEFTRYANAEIHNIASVVGGVASQEAVKIITGQYIPLDNTYVFNGIASTAGVYRL